jgi:hypothetical protein
MIDGGAGLSDFELTAPSGLVGGDSGTLRVRELPAAEFGRLSSVLPEFRAGVDPHTARVVVGEDEMGRIKALWGVFATVHIEPLVISPEHQKNPGLIRALWRKVHAILQETKQEISFAIMEEGSPAAPLALRLGFQPIEGATLFWVKLPAPVGKN